MSVKQEANWVALLVDPAFRASFLKGVYSDSLAKAAFKCAHLAEQLSDCTAREGEHDAKVCEILLWEETLCWSRYVASDAFEAVRQCYTKHSGAGRAKCDPLVEQLRRDVAGVRQELQSAAVPPLLAQCPSLAAARSDVEANEALGCLCNVLSPSGCSALKSCIAQNDGAAAPCLKDPSHVQLVERLGGLYGQAKLSAYKK